METADSSEPLATENSLLYVYLSMCLFLLLPLEAQGIRETLRFTTVT
jgi:hypothetical protein